MKKNILFLIFISFYIVSYNQVINGTIKDKETKTNILFASIYFNGTFTGTTSDQFGKFELDISKNKSMPLTVSAIGYYSATLENLTIDKPIVIYLIPKVFDLKESTISAKSLVRKRKAYLRLFRNKFLGTNKNAVYCKILNEDDINFNYESDRDTVKAFATKPLEIDNKALGYKITYYLDKFEHSKKYNTTSFYGNIIFNEDLTQDITKKETYQHKREEAYWGSRMHFFRALWADQLRTSEYKFLIRNEWEINLKYKDLVLEDDFHKKHISYYERLEIKFLSNLSYINFLKSRVYFDKNGYFDLVGILWKGEMMKHRIADWLPYEYEIK